MGNGAIALPARSLGAGLPPLANSLGVSRAREPVVPPRPTPEAAAPRLLSGAVASPVGAATQQLEFSFVQEMRASSLARFQLQTQQVSDGLPAATRSTYLEASQQIAARFSLSIQVSESVLNGFAGASEAAAGDAGAIDRLLAMTEDFKALADELLNRIFGMLKDFMDGEGSFDERVGRFLEAIQDIDFSGLFQGFSGGTGARSIGVQLEFEFSFSEEVTLAVQEADPLVLDLDGDGIELTSYREGARFDITGSGRKVTTAFVTGGDAFLALDRNGNGRIDDGTELFGDQRGASNGFEELRKLDTNGDGMIDARDKDFDALRLWRDNGNGITEAGELLTLREAGIASINLAYQNVNQSASGGNRLTQIASFTRTDGTTGKAADAMLNYLA